QGIERELFQVIAITVAVGPETGVRAAGAAGHERRALLLVAVGEGLVGLDLRQRFDAAAGLLFGRIDELRKIGIPATAAGKQRSKQRRDDGPMKYPSLSRAHRFSFLRRAVSPDRPCAFQLRRRRVRRRRGSDRSWRSGRVAA